MGSTVKCTCTPSKGFNCKHCWGVEIADEGRQEEFHQRNHNGFMQYHHKNRRLDLQVEYKKRFDNDR